jgi:hypothetical protein
MQELRAEAAQLERALDDVRRRIELLEQSRTYEVDDAAR